jgi:hypothetical protein
LRRRTRVRQKEAGAEVGRGNGKGVVERVADLVMCKWDLPVVGCGVKRIEPLWLCDQQ